MEKKEERNEENRITPPASSSASQKSPHSTKDKLLMALIIIGVVSFGLFAINQFFSWKYKSVFLQTPCTLCRELNPEVEACFKIVETETIKNNYEINLSNFILESGS